MSTILRKIDPLAETLASAFNALKSQIGAGPLLLLQKLVDAAAGTATAETIVFVATGPITFRNIGFMPSAALTADNTNNATITVRRRAADGTGAATVVAITTNVASGNWTQWVRKSFGALANNSLTAGQMLTIEITKAGTGVAVPAGLLSEAPAHIDQAEYSITAANASDLATSLTLVNQMRAVSLVHRADTVLHKIADAATITAPVATDLATAQTLANEIKADHNTHAAEVATIHMAADGVNTVSTADATDQNSLNTLLNAMKTVLNAHYASGPQAASIRLVDA